MSLTQRFEDWWERIMQKRLRLGYGMLLTAFLWSFLAPLFAAASNTSSQVLMIPGLWVGRWRSQRVHHIRGSRGTFPR